MNKLNIIILNGLPATGKTTLGRQVAKELELPFISKDDFKETLFDTLGYSDREWSEKIGAAGFKLMYNAVESQLKANKSLVVETYFNPKYDEKKFEELQKKYNAKIIQIFCKCDGTVLFERFKKRVESGERHKGYDDKNALPIWKTIMQNNDLQPLNINGETIVVNTTDFEKIDLGVIMKIVKNDIKKVVT